MLPVAEHFVLRDIAEYGMRVLQAKRTTGGIEKRNWKRC